MSAIAALSGFGFWSSPARAHATQVALQPVVDRLIPPPQALFGKDRLAILVLGIDYNYDNGDQPYSAGARSDTIMAVSLDLPTKTMRELSVPRDMDVVLPNGREDKINAAYAEGGPQEAEAVVAKFLGIPKFDRYVVLRINAASDLIDALGGIELDVKNSDALKGAGPNGPVDYDDNWGHLHVHLKPGRQSVTGKQAVGYARFRHDWCSDPCRILRQQQVIRAVVDEVERHKLNTLLHLQSLLQVARRDIQTDFAPEEQLSLAAAFANVNVAAIKTDQIPYVGTKDLAAGNVIVADEAAKAALVARSFGAEPQVTAKLPTGDPVFDSLRGAVASTDVRL